MSFFEGWGKHCAKVPPKHLAGYQVHAVFSCLLEASQLVYDKLLFGPVAGHSILRAEDTAGVYLFGVFQ